MKTQSNGVPAPGAADTLPEVSRDQVQKWLVADLGCCRTLMDNILGTPALLEVVTDHFYSAYLRRHEAPLFQTPKTAAEQVIGKSK